MKLTLWNSGALMLVLLLLIADFEYPQYTISLFDGSGRRLAEKPANSGRRPPAEFLSLPDGEIRYQDLSEIETGIEHGRRVALKRYTWAPDLSVFLVVGRPLNEMKSELNLIAGSLFLAVPLTLLLAGWGGWLMARKNLAPIKEMSESAQEIGAENMDQRLPVVNPRRESQLPATLDSRVCLR